MAPCGLILMYQAVILVYFVQQPTNSTLCTRQHCHCYL